MPRKIFISFLGTGEYKCTRYYFNENREDLSPEIYYVQEHILTKNIVDMAYLFVTDEARENNYNNKIYIQDKKPLIAKKQGFKSTLERLKKQGLLGDFMPVEIPNGYTEVEIWTVFKAVFDKIEKGDEVIVDVTFGFRSLPMLVVVLLNYAKALKDITIKAIYYGNYEAGREEQDLLLKSATNNDEKTTLSKRVIEAPIFNLLPFVELQAWTYAAQSFATGNAQPLSEITAYTHPDFSNDINYFTKSLQTCRGPALIEDIDINRLKVQIREMAERSDIEVVLLPLLDKVSAKLAPFESQQLSNGIAAVDWCIQHNMIQQGITFLQETLISYMVERFWGRDMLTDVYKRDLAGSALQLLPAKGNRHLDPLKNSEFSSKSDNDKANLQDIYTKMREFVKNKKPLRELYGALVGKTGFRNDINHCGYRKPYLQPEELNESLRTLFEKIKSLNL
jgi:CRISPR-associated Csx2 family protein